MFKNAMPMRKNLHPLVSIEWLCLLPCFLHAQERNAEMPRFSLTNRVARPLSCSLHAQERNAQMPRFYCPNNVLLQLGKEFVDEDEENGQGKLYFTGTGYTINLIPQAIILGVLAFRKYPSPYIVPLRMRWLSWLKTACPLSHQRNPRFEISAVRLLL